MDEDVDVNQEPEQSSPAERRYGANIGFVIFLAIFFIPILLSVIAYLLNFLHELG